MEKIISGKTHIFGDNIDTDQIYPGQFLEIVGPKEIALHCLKGARPSFAEDFQKGEIVVAGKNFGCGSSREHAATTLKEIGVSAVLAKSFARIFYRNAINLGLMVVVCTQIDELDLTEGQEITIDIENGIVVNNSTGKQIACEPVSEFAMEILSYGGMVNMIKAQK